MPMLAPADLSALLESSGGVCVSLYAPMQRAGAKTRENRIRFKNVIAEAREHLQQQLSRPADADDILAPALRLLDDDEYWQHQSDGLAVFLSADGAFHEYRVPQAFEALAFAGDCFHVKPLLPLLSGDRRFFVLALSENDVRLLACTRHGAERVPLPDVPTSMDEALWMDDPERQLQMHTGVPRQRDAIHHGHGGHPDAEDSRRRRFCHKVDQGLQEFWRDETAPIVLAGVERLRAEYAEVSKLPNLQQQGLEGNVEVLTDSELHARAWDMIGPEFRASQEQAAERYRGLHGTGRTGNRLETCIPAAVHGRIDTVFVPIDEHAWGAIDATAQTGQQPAPSVELHEAREPLDRDLLDIVAAQTLAHGGTVYAVPRQDLPDEGPLAAVFRY